MLKTPKQQYKEGIERYFYYLEMIDEGQGSQIKGLLNKTAKNNRKLDFEMIEIKQNKILNKYGKLQSKN